MKLIYATKNKAKFDHMVEMLEGLDIELISLLDIKGGIEMPEPKEEGRNPLENAEEKAQHYFKYLKQPLFSCDSGLFIKEATDEEQPGVMVRRPFGHKGERLDDNGMINYYSSMAEKYGGKITAYYKNAVCLILDYKQIICYDGHDIDDVEFYIVSKPHVVRKEGFPIDSLSMHPGTGKYYFDLNPEDFEEDNHIKRGFREFFKRVLER